MYISQVGVIMYGWYDNEGGGSVPGDQSKIAFIQPRGASSCSQKNPNARLITPKIEGSFILESLTNRIHYV